MIVRYKDNNTTCAMLQSDITSIYMNGFVLVLRGKSFNYKIDLTEYAKNDVEFSALPSYIKQEIEKHSNGTLMLNDVIDSYSLIDITDFGRSKEEQER